MLKQVAEGVLVQSSEFLQTNTTVVLGPDGVLLIDPGLTGGEFESLASQLRALKQPVVAGFSTHPDWDHVLWHAELGDAPRYATALGAGAMQRLRSQPNWREQAADALPPEHADEIPTDLFGLLTALPENATTIPWDGPTARILEHRAHAEGHAALLIEDHGTLIASDMLSDNLIPLLDTDAAEPLEDYLATLRLFEGIADRVDVVIPGHGSAGDRNELRRRIDADRAYVGALRNGREPNDQRIGPDAPLYWLPELHQWQAKRLAERQLGQTPE
jgi:glyoxylase-like metal-dependent hydrolase (beta-lactamase superfamily II)